MTTSPLSQTPTHYKSSGLASNLPLPLRDSAHSHRWEEPECGVAADASALPTQELYSYELLALIRAVVFIEVSDCCIKSPRSAPRRCLCPLASLNASVILPELLCLRNKTQRLLLSFRITQAKHKATATAVAFFAQTPDQFGYCNWFAHSTVSLQCLFCSIRAGNAMF